MNEKLTEKMSTALENDVTNFDNMGLNDENKVTALKIIATEESIILKERTTDLDEKKFEQQKAMDGARLAFDKAKSTNDCKYRDQDIELRKEELELRKRELEERLKATQTDSFVKLEQLEEQKKTNKIQRVSVIVTFVSAGVAALVTMFKAIAYVALTRDVHRHDYKDYTPESKASKELRSKLD